MRGDLSAPAACEHLSACWQHSLEREGMWVFSCQPPNGCGLKAEGHTLEESRKAFYRKADELCERSRNGKERLTASS